MKLLNHTTKYFSIALLAIVGAWGVIFYVNMLDEVYDSLDDGLDNYKLLIIEKAHKDSTVLHKTAFEESNYSIHEITKQAALPMRDLYRDTLLYMQNEADYEPVRLLNTAFEMHGKYYQLQIISSMVEEDDLIEDLLYSIIWLYLAMIFTIVIVNNILLRRIWKPFDYLIDQLKNFRLGHDKSINMLPSQVEEFNLLNQTTETLIQRALEIFKSQKEFIENASHELQTPLAISLNKLELLAERNNLSESDITAIGTVIQTLERLTRLNKSLLLLSKIENNQFADTAVVNFNKVVKGVVEELNDYAAFTNITLTLQETEVVEKSMNADLAQIMLLNLIKNSIRHNHENGFVEINISTNTISIANTGKTETLNNRRIFERFHKETQQNQSTGLGLSIVKAIVNLYGLKISYQYSNLHTFTLTFA